jgi:putative NADPH-quinone reductase
MRRILIIQGRPDASEPHFCHALADAYAQAPPGPVKVFFEQALRRLAYSSELGPFKEALLKGRSLRIVITMGMPAWFSRLVYGAHGLKAMKVGIFAFVGFKPIRTSLIGNVAGTDGRGWERWIASMKALGAAAA